MKTNIIIESVKHPSPWLPYIHNITSIIIFIWYFTARATIMNFFRIPLNMIVVTILLQVSTVCVYISLYYSGTLLLTVRPYFMVWLRPSCDNHLVDKYTYRYIIYYVKSQHQWKFLIVDLIWLTGQKMILILCWLLFVQFK